MRLLCFFICVFHSLYGATPTQPQLITEEIKGVPNPVNLKADWWDYFDVDHATFKKRAEEAIVFYTDLKSALPISVQQDAIPIIERIISSLQALSQPPTLSLVPEEKANSYQAAYTFDEFKKLGMRLNDLNSRIKVKAVQVSLAEKNLEGDFKFIDSQMAAYLQLKDQTPEKLLLGLKIISMRLNSETEQRQIEILQSRNRVLKKEIEIVQSEIEVARTRLSFTEASLQEVEASRISTNDAITEAKKEVDRLQSALAQLTEDTDENERALLIQELIRASVTEAQNEVKLIAVEAETEFIRLGKPEITIDVPEAIKKITTWKNGLQKLSRERESWLESTLIELERALQKSTEAPTTDVQKNVTLSEETVLQLQQFDNELFTANFLLDELMLSLHEEDIPLGARIRAMWQRTLLFIKARADWLEVSLFKIGESPVTLLAIFKSLIALCIGYLISVLARRGIRNIAKKGPGASHSGIYTLGRLTFYFLFFITLIIASSMLGIDFTAFALIAGALTVGIGFALQPIVSNFSAGIAILLEKTVRIGDILELTDGTIGSVKEVRVRTTLIKTFDNIELLVPNSELVSKQFTNWTLSDHVRRYRIPFGLAFGTDKEKLREALVKKVSEDPLTAEEYPTDVWLVNIGESSLDFELIVWVNLIKAKLKPTAIPAHYLWLIESQIREHNFKIPYPVRDVNLYSKTP